VFERCLAVAPLTPPASEPNTADATPAKTMVKFSTSIEGNEAQIAEMPAMDAQRELLVHFFQLRTPQRYEAAFNAGLLRDGDDALDPQVMWAEVFRRAVEENKLADFWTAVAAHTPIMRQNPNPFAKAPDA